ncbi:hypothetical protein [Tautonia marina]|uniref:hypothetical protein n=1 Tax=Tautonia marina TaxID=2653855 RepID=UPI001260F6CA|nr:hypothetical protein [Tautonia marina]
MLRDEDLKALLEEIRDVREALFVESEEQVAGWNYERAETGLPFAELPRSDRYVMLEDYVDWSRYLELGLTRGERDQLMMDAARVETDFAESIIGYEFGELSGEEARALYQRLMEAAASQPSLTEGNLGAVLDAMREAGLDAPAEPEAARVPSPSAIANGRNAPEPVPEKSYGVERDSGHERGR